MLPLELDYHIKTNLFLPALKLIPLFWLQDFLLAILLIPLFRLQDFLLAILLTPLFCLLVFPTFHSLRINGKLSFTLRFLLLLSFRKVSQRVLFLLVKVFQGKKVCRLPRTNSRSLP